MLSVACAKLFNTIFVCLSIPQTVRKSAKRTIVRSKRTYQFWHPKSYQCLPIPKYSMIISLAKHFQSYINHHRLAQSLSLVSPTLTSFYHVWKVTDSCELLQQQTIKQTKQNSKQLPIICKKIEILVLYRVTDIWEMDNVNTEEAVFAINKYRKYIYG